MLCTIIFYKTDHHVLFSKNQNFQIYLNFKGFRNAGFPHFLSLGDKILVLFSNEWIIIKILNRCVTKKQNFSSIEAISNFVNFSVNLFKKSQYCSIKFQKTSRLDQESSRIQERTNIYIIKILTKYFRSRFIKGKYLQKLLGNVKTVKGKLIKCPSKIFERSKKFSSPYQRGLTFSVNWILEVWQ